MIQREYRVSRLAQLRIAGGLSFIITCVSIAIADHQSTPELVRYVVSPGYVLGLRLMSGHNFFDALSVFGWVAFSGNAVYFGALVLAALWKLRWPKTPWNPNHRFWMERRY
jgi:hypothetical protein